MTETLPSQVRDFVALVRERLADLSVEEQQELTEGLEADLADLVDERGGDALGDPDAYARDLRSAAGHAPVMGRRPGGRGVRRALMDATDSLHESWDRVLDSFPGDLRGFLTALAPAWWVLRAVTAWLVAQDLRGPYVVVDWGWLAVLAVFFVVSVQVGRGAWGIDRLLRTSVLARLLLVGLNVFAVAMVPGAADRTAWAVAEDRAWMYGGGTDGSEVNPGVVTYQGGQACVLQVRDRRDRVIKKAYVWDATGQRRLPMNTRDC